MSRLWLNLLLWYTARLPARVISDRGVRYLERYFVGRLFGCCIYVHRFLASDPVRGLHDHPWGWAFSLVLRGLYFEQKRSGYRMVRWLNCLSGDTFHRVVLPFPVAPRVDIPEDHVHRAGRTAQPRECWTLFVHGPKTKPWGFLRPAWLDDKGAAEAYCYVAHKDQDASADSAAWAATAPKGREVR